MVKDSAQARGDRRQSQLLPTSSGLSCQPQQICTPKGETMSNQKVLAAGCLCSLADQALLETATLAAQGRRGAEPGGGGVGGEGGFEDYGMQVC